MSREKTLPRNQKGKGMYDQSCQPKEQQSLDSSSGQTRFDDKNLFELLEPYYNNTKQGPPGKDIITNANEKNRKAIETVVEQIFKLKGCSISDGGVELQGKRLTRRMGRFGWVGKSVT